MTKGKIIGITLGSILGVGLIATAIAVPLSLQAKKNDEEKNKIDIAARAVSVFGGYNLGESVSRDTFVTETNIIFATTTEYNNFARVQFLDKYFTGVTLDNVANLNVVVSDGTEATEITIKVTGNGDWDVGGVDNPGLSIENIKATTKNIEFNQTDWNTALEAKFTADMIYDNSTKVFIEEFFNTTETDANKYGWFNVDDAASEAADWDTAAKINVELIVGTGLAAEATPNGNGGAVADADTGAGAQYVPVITYTLKSAENDIINTGTFYASPIMLVDDLTIIGKSGYPGAVTVTDSLAKAIVDSGVTLTTLNEALEYYGTDAGKTMLQSFLTIANGSTDTGYDPAIKSVEVKTITQGTTNVLYDITYIVHYNDGYSGVAGPTLEEIGLSPAS